MSKKIYIHMQLCLECSDPDYYGLCDLCLFRLISLKQSADIDTTEQARLALAAAIEEGDCNDCEHCLIACVENGACKLCN